MSTVTPSALPRLAHCIGGAVLPNASEEFETAARGHALHGVAADLARGRTVREAVARCPEAWREDAEGVDWAALPPRTHGAPEVGLALELGTSRALHLGNDMTRETVRAAKPAGWMGMLLDWVGVADYPDGRRVVEVEDYKFGWLEDMGPASEHLQLLTYGAAALLAFGADEVRCRLRHWDGRRWRVDEAPPMDALDAEAHLERVRAMLAKVEAARERCTRGEQPPLSPGRWCAWCPAQRFCPAQVGQALAVLGDLRPLSERGALTPEEAGRLYARLDAAEDVLARLKADLHKLAAQVPLPLPDGRELRLEPEEVTQVDVEKALPLLRQRYPEAVVRDAVRVKTTMPWDALRVALATHELPARQEMHAQGRLGGRKPSGESLMKEVRALLEKADAVRVTVRPTVRAVKPALPAGDETL